MQNKLTLLAGILILASLPDASADQTTHKDCSSNIENIQKGGTVNINCYFNRRSPQDVYLIATHPTTVKAKKLTFLNMFEDNGRSYLSIELKNKSEIPARDVAVDLMDPSSAKTYSALKPFKLSQSNAAIRLGTRKWTIPRTTSLEFPLVSVEQLLSIVHPVIDLEHYCAIDGSLSLQEALEDAPTPQFPVPSRRPDTVRLPVIIRIHYKTIFEETITQYITAFVLYAERSNTSDVWYPSKGKALPLKCAKY